MHFSSLPKPLVEDHNRSRTLIGLLSRTHAEEREVRLILSVIAELQKFKDTNCYLKGSPEPWKCHLRAEGGRM